MLLVEIGAALLSQGPSRLTSPTVAMARRDLAEAAIGQADIDQ